MVTPNTYAHYKCNDDAANTVVTDDGSGANNGVGNVNTSNYSVVGKINDAFEFNGIDEYIDVDNLATDIASDTTGSFSLWLKIPNLVTQTHVFCISDKSGNSRFLLLLKSGYIPRVALLDASNQKEWIIDGGAITEENTWYNIVLTHDGITPRMYLNADDVGVFDDSSTPASYLSVLTGVDTGRLAATVFAGTGGGESFFFIGTLDDFRYYKNITLTQQDVLNLYNGGLGTEDDPPPFFGPGFPHSQAFIIS